MMNAPVEAPLPRDHAAKPTTDQLIAWLAAGETTPIRPPHRRWWALGLGLLGAVLLFIGSDLNLLDLRHFGQQPLFWLRELLLLALGLASARLVTRVGYPGQRLADCWRAVGAVLLVMGACGGLFVAAIPATAAHDALWGETWAVCSLFIALLAMPFFVATRWVLQGLAPTQLTRAGAAAGLFAGAAAALLYSLHCPEISPTFVAVWYSLGIAIPTAIGAGLGPRLLGW